MNNNDDFEEDVVAPGEQPSGQILTPKAVIEASEDLREYRQIVNAELMKRGCDSRLISIECSGLNVEALKALDDELQDAGWDSFIDDATICIG